jgi:hypothetical protein
MMRLDRVSLAASATWAVRRVREEEGSKRRGREGEEKSNRRAIEE